MQYIFMDESGDLGFDLTKKGTSKYFVITMLMVENKRVLDKIVKKVYQKLSQSERSRRPSYLHCHYEDENVRLKLLDEVAKQDLKFMTIVVDKQKTAVSQFKHIQHLYNFITKELLYRIFEKDIVKQEEQVELAVSKRETNKNLNKEFVSFFQEFTERNNLTIKIKSSTEEKGLQIVDFVSWAIFRYYEYDDNSFYKIIENQIIEEGYL